MLKETADSIAPSFTRLLQLSLSTAKVPSCWKQANVLPIFKKGDQSDFGNYRPVSLLNIIQRFVKRSFLNICLITVEIMILSLCISLDLPLVIPQCISWFIFTILFVKH